MRGIAQQLLSPVTADSYLPGHGDETYDVTHYDLEIDYKVETNHLSGRARIDIRAGEELSQFTLDLHGLRAAKVTIPEVGVSKYTTRRGKLIVTMKAPIAAGSTCSVVVTYSGTPGQVHDSAGSAGWEELEDGALVAGQPGGAPAWFPCNDRPSAKASFRIAVTTGSGYHVVANGNLVGTVRGASRTTWTYEQIEPMATYLAAVHVGRYAETKIASHPVRIRLVAPPGLPAAKKAALRDQPELMEYFVKTFGDYPFGQYTVVITADELEIPLEAQSLSVFGSNALGSEWTTARLVAHELAHQWFGNSLTVDRWSDIWLHEGFACYAEWLWSEESGGRSADDRAREHWAELSALDQDLTLTDPGPELMFDDRLYKRGALTLHALRLTIGDERFFGLIRDWTQTHRHSNVTTAMFIDQAAARSAADLADLFDAWLFEPSLPELPPAP